MANKHRISVLKQNSNPVMTIFQFTFALNVSVHFH